MGTTWECWSGEIIFDSQQLNCKELSKDGEDAQLFPISLTYEHRDI